MSSGQKRVIINTRERAVSDDINNLQAYLAADRAGILRRVLNRPSTDRDQITYPGASGLPATLPVATRGTLHDVIDGLLVRPDGGTYLLIDSGVAGMFLPGYSGLTADDVPYILVNDPGVSSSAVLTFTANVGAGPRIDVVECQAVDTLISSGSRDIYDPLTGLFTPAVVEKVRKATLTYRIRLGTPDAGFPAVAQDWLPLAVVITPTTAASFANCDIYDVRPLISSRQNEHMTNAQPEVANYGNADVYDRNISGRTNKVSGWAIAESHGYRVGGLMQRNTPASPADFGVAGEVDYFDPLATANHMGGAAAPSITDGDMNVVLLAFPMGLPRWVRYTQVPAPASTIVGAVSLTGRLPRGPNGILLLGRPASMTAKGQVPVASYPPLFGTGATAAQNDLGLVVGWTVGNGTGHQTVNSHGKRHHIRSGAAAFYPFSFTETGSAFPGQFATFSSPTLVSSAPSGLTLATNGNRYPASAHRVIGRIIATGQLSANAQAVTSRLRNQTSGGLIEENEAAVTLYRAASTGSNSVAFEQTLDIPTDSDELGPPVEFSPMSASGTTRARLELAVIDVGVNFSVVPVAIGCITGWEDY